jgi:hypothetical protein
VFEVIHQLLRQCIKPTQQMILNLIKASKQERNTQSYTNNDMHVGNFVCWQLLSNRSCNRVSVCTQVELAHINTSHPDFIGGKKVATRMKSSRHGTLAKRRTLNDNTGTSNKTKLLPPTSDFWFHMHVQAILAQQQLQQQQQQAQAQHAQSAAAPDSAPEAKSMGGPATSSASPPAAAAPTVAGKVRPSLLPARPPPFSCTCTMTWPDSLLATAAATASSPGSADSPPRCSPALWPAPPRQHGCTRGRRVRTRILLAIQANRGRGGGGRDCTGLGPV